MQQMIQCYKCGSQNVLGQQFCTTCGEKFNYKCPQCGSNINAGLKSCPGCSAELDWDTPEKKNSVEDDITGEATSNKQNTGEVFGAKAEGSPSRRKMSPWLIAFIAIVLCIVVVFAIDAILQKKSSIGLSGISSQPQENVSLEITADDLIQAFMVDNELADAKYNGEILEVTGTVKSIGKNYVGTLFVKLSGGGIEAWRVQCMFDQKYEAELDQLNEEQTIVIQGECDGFFMTDVKMKDCVVIEEVNAK